MPPDRRGTNAEDQQQADDRADDLILRCVRQNEGKDRRPEDDRNRIQLAGDQQVLVLHESVADQSPSDRRHQGHHAHDHRRHRETEAQVPGHGRCLDREESGCDTIDVQEEFTEWTIGEPSKRVEGHQTRTKCQPDVQQIIRPEHRDIQDDVAQRTTSNSRDPSENKCTEEVHTAIRDGQDGRDGVGDRPCHGDEERELVECHGCEDRRGLGSILALNDHKDQPTMKSTRFIALLLLFIAAEASAQAPIVHLRADSLVSLSEQQRALSWSSVTGDAVFRADTSVVAPLLVPDAMNGQPALRFANDGHFIGPSVFPTGEDYTLYVVMRWDGGNASNNLVSGRSHALYLGNSPYPRVLHGANFGQQAISTVPVSGPTVIRVTYQASSGIARIGINNVLGDEAVVPSNTDAALFIGSYAGGNWFWGDIAEVILYDRSLDSAERVTLEEEIHQRYAIERAPDPAPPVVRWDRAPEPNHFVPLGGSIVLDGEIIDESVERITICS